MPRKIIPAPVHFTKSAALGLALLAACASPKHDYPTPGERYGQATAAAEAYYAEGDLSSARDEYRKALGYAERGEDRGMVISTLINVGVMSAQLSDLETAREAFGRAAEAAEAAGRADFARQALIGKAEVLLRAESVVAARSLYEQTLADNTLGADDPARVVLMNGLALAEAAQGRMAGAIERLRDAEALARRLEDNRQLAATLLNLAGLHLAEAELGDALRAVDEALVLDEQEKYKPGTASDLVLLAQLNELLGEIAQAIAYFDRARLLFKETGQMREEKEVREHMARLRGLTVTPFK